jgi:hypothetical protein
VLLLVAAALAALGTLPASAATAARRTAALTGTATAVATAPPICGQTSSVGVTPVNDPAIKVSFILKDFWVCVPGSGPLPATVTLLERVDPDVGDIVVPELRKASVGAFELLAGAKIPCLLAVDDEGGGSVPSPSTWQQEIADEAKASGTTVTALHVTGVTVPAGKFLRATFSQTEPGGAVLFIDEYLGASSSKLVVAAFQGSPTSTVIAQASQVMATFR